jgi:hypothetical protein
MSRPDGETRRRAENALADLAAERSDLVAHAEEYESAAADIRGDVERLDRLINEIHSILDK